MSLENAFDGTDRPSRKIIQDCVHCGFCLSSCPTYLQTGNELDSPRGRIHLIKAASEGRIPMGSSLVKHLDLCLGCLACETACPSGVKYGSLIEMSRGQIERRFKRGFGEKVLRTFIFSVFPYSRRLRLLLPFVYMIKVLGLKKIFPSTFLDRISLSASSMFHMLPEVNSIFGETLATFYPSLVERRKRVALLSGCVQGVFFPEINRATVEVLRASGCEVLVPRDQGCCGALSIHSGRLEEGRRFARRLVRLLDSLDVDSVIVNSAGCGSTMKEYVEILRGDTVYSEVAERISAKTMDVMEFLCDMGIGAQMHPLDIKVTYQDACHVVHGQGIRAAPRELLARIPELEFTEMQRSDHCCGSAGIYNIVQPEMSSKLLSGKIREIEKTGADYLAVANPGCMIQIRKGLLGSDSGIKTVHPVEIINWSLKGGIS